MLPDTSPLLRCVRDLQRHPSSEGNLQMLVHFLHVSFWNLQDPAELRSASGLLRRGKRFEVSEELIKRWVCAWDQIRSDHQWTSRQLRLKVQARVLWQIRPSSLHVSYLFFLPSILFCLKFPSSHLCIFPSIHVPTFICFLLSFPLSL